MQNIFLFRSLRTFFWLLAVRYRRFIVPLLFFVRCTHLIERLLERPLFWLLVLKMPRRERVYGKKLHPLKHGPLLFLRLHNVREYKVLLEALDLVGDVGPVQGVVDAVAAEALVVSLVMDLKLIKSFL